MMNTSSPSGMRPLSEINVTPMVDIMLVLLIIFMVTAPMLQQGVQVSLPQTKAATLDSQESRLSVSLTASKQVFLNDFAIPLENLREKLVGNLKLRADKQVYLFADRSLDYGFVVDVMATLKEAGVDNVAMVTEEPTAFH